MVILFEGPDNTGKTDISKELSKEINIPHFKCSFEKKIFEGHNLGALYFSAQTIYELLIQTKLNIIQDRSFISEYVYSKAYNRKTDFDFIKEMDKKYSSKLDAKFIYCYKTTYKEYNDELVEKKKIFEIEKFYLEYLSKTKMKYFKIDTSDENLKKQIRQIKEWLSI